MPVEGDDTRARCRYCRLLLRAHNSDLRNHARTSKHATNVAFGRPCSDPFTRPSTSRTKVSAAANRRKRFGYSREIRPVSTEENPYSLERPDDSLTSLSSLHTLLSFGWSCPAVPETTLILQNNLALDEQLIASLPQMPDVRYHVKKDPSSDTAAMKSGSVTSIRLTESVQQAPADKELTSDTLSHVARSLTLWEFMLLKLDHGRGNAEQAKIAEILTEFSELHAKVKAVSHNVLKAATASSEADKTDTVMLDSEELARCLGFHTGLHYINATELNKATKIDCHSLIPPMRPRLRPGSTTRYIRPSSKLGVVEGNVAGDVSRQYNVESVDGGDQRYVIDPELLDPSSSVIVHGLDGTTAGHLVLVSENGELLLQCDAKGFPQLSSEDIRPVNVESASCEDSCERDETLFVADDDNTELTCDLKVLSSCVS